jgi:hypothetical protein
MKNYLALFTLLTCLVAPARAVTTVALDAGKLTSPPLAPMQIDNTLPSSNGSLLLLLDLGPSNTIDNSLTPGNFVAGTNFVLAAGGFNTNGGTDETLTSFSVTTGTVGDDLALRWFPQLTYAQYQGGALTASGDYFGTYAPTPLGSTPDGGDAWTLPTSGATIDLNFFTSDSDGGGSQSPSAGFTNYEIPEPSTFALFGIGSLVLVWFARQGNAVHGACFRFRRLQISRNASGCTTLIK